MNGINSRKEEFNSDNYPDKAVAAFNKAATSFNKAATALNSEERIGLMGTSSVESVSPRPMQRRTVSEPFLEREGGLQYFSDSTSSDFSDSFTGSDEEFWPRSQNNILETEINYFLSVNSENRDVALNFIFSKYQIESSSKEGKALRNYFNNRVNFISPQFSWKDLAERALETKNLNKSFKLSDLVPSADKDQKSELSSSSYVHRSRPSSAQEELLQECLEESLKSALQQDYEERFHSLIAELAIDPVSSKYQELHISAQNSLKIMTEDLQRMLNDPSVTSSGAIQEVYKNTIIAFYFLRGYATQSLSKSPQFCKLENGMWSVLKPAPPIENVVFSGGGMKGVGYLGFLKAVKLANIFTNLKRLAGSSAGAMTAALIAAGMDINEVEEANARVDFMKAVVASSSDPVIQENTSPSSGGNYGFRDLGFSGNYLMKQVNKEMIKSIARYFNSLEKEGLEKKLNTLDLSFEDKSTLLELHHAVVLSSNDVKTHLITFRELALLQKIDNRFKELTVTAFNLTQQKTVYHNVQTSPDMAIAEAVVTSGALPLIYKAKINKATGDRLADGGIGSNIPTEVFSAEPQEKTMVLGFHKEGHFYDLVNRDAADKNANPHFFVVQLSGNPSYGESVKEDRKKLKDAGPNAISIKHGKLETTSFSASKKRRKAAERQAEIHTWEQLALRQNQATHHVFETFEEAIDSMSNQELEDVALEYASHPHAQETLSREERSMISQAAQRKVAERSEDTL